jgi:hypothetical protein
MIRCVKCGCSRLDSKGIGCALCGGSLSDRTEQCYITEDTKAKLLAHAEELKAHGITIKEYETLRKDAGATLGAIGLVLQVADSLDSGVLRKLVRHLRDLRISEQEILRLRLDEPAQVSTYYRADKAGGRSTPNRDPR